MKVAINGFGRIGRTTLRVMLERGQEKNLIAVNDLADAETLATLLKYDSNYGTLDIEVVGRGGQLQVGGHAIAVLSQAEPADLPWKKLGIDVVIESTGRFTNKEGASAHIKAGAKRVIISAPAQDGKVKTIVLGVNEDTLADKDVVLSNASCTTNCIAPVAAVMVARFKVRKAVMTTVHAYTADQNLQDGPHRDLRRARAAAVNIVPTSTGATIAATEAVPELAGLFGGVALRVPVAVGSLSDFTFVLGNKTTVEQVNKAFRQAATESRYQGILTVTDEPVVSSDIIGDPHSAIVDLSLTQVVDGDLVKVFAWYDNEYGYCNRLVDQLELMSHN